jgi:hypothetical protein
MQKEAFMKFDCSVLKYVSALQASVKSRFKYKDISRYAIRLSCFDFLITEFKRITTVCSQQIFCYLMNSTLHCFKLQDMC